MLILVRLKTALTLANISNVSLHHSQQIIFKIGIYVTMPFIWASQLAVVVSNLPANAGDVRNTSSIPESGRSTAGGHDNPLQYFCLENPMDRGAWQTVGLQRVGHDWATNTHTHSNARGMGSITGRELKSYMPGEKLRVFAGRVLTIWTTREGSHATWSLTEKTKKQRKPPKTKIKKQGMPTHFKFC